MIRLFLSITALSFSLSGLLLAQGPAVLGLEPVAGDTGNADLISSRRAYNAKGSKNVTVFAGDNVIPQVVDGAGWRTSFVLTNLDSKALRFTVAFLTDNGDDMVLPIVGGGNYRGVTITLPPSASTTVETSGTTRTLTQGWAFILTDSVKDRISGMAVFRAQVAGRPDQEAVVPIGSMFDSRFVLLYDNSGGYATSMAIVNPDLDPTTIDVTVRNGEGAILKQSKMTLESFRHQAFSTATTWPETAGQKGSIEFRVSGDSLGVSALGLRFHPGGSFTSFHTLSNVDWML